MLHCEIRASYNLNKHYNMFPWIGDQPHIVVLRFRGQGPKIRDNYGTNLSPTFNKNQDLLPWI